jgi:cellulose synthase/poly-beta-1,6-N-acetylglucosamine synthase-like glycosyltransferase
VSAVFWTLAAHALGCVAYLAVLAGLAFAFKPRVRDGGEPPRMAVIIPAHNEEAGIADTVGAVFACAYPHDRVRVWVVADNCRDRTASRAEEAGAVAVVRDDPADPGKGQALDWLLRNRPEILHWAQCVAFLDADTVPDRGFLSAAAQSLMHEANDAVQGFYGVLNPGESWRTGLMAAALALAHHLRPAGREALGGTAGLKGNGMAFSSGLLRRTGWPAKGIVEDLEYSLDLLESGIRVVYNPQAVVLAEMASTSSQAASQRRRWEGGRFELALRRIPRILLDHASPWRARLDAVLDLATPPLAVLCLELAGLWAVSPWAAPEASALFPAALVILALVVASALIQRKQPLKVWLRLLAAPAYIAWKIWLYAAMAVTRSAGWTRTARSAELSKDKTDRETP